MDSHVFRENAVMQIGGYATRCTPIEEDDRILYVGALWLDGIGLGAPDWRDWVLGDEWTGKAVGLCFSLAPGGSYSRRTTL